MVFVMTLFLFSLVLMSQLRHTELSGQAQQLLNACNAHKERIRDLFQSKLEEVRLVSQPSDLPTLLGQ